MTFSVIIPVHNSLAFVSQCIASVLHSERLPEEIIVVDDGSTEDLSVLTERYPIRLLRFPGPPHGPAFARNRGTEVATGDVLIFFDADVTVHPDTVRRIEAHFLAEPGLAALMGSYDDQPPADGLVSRFKNLLHHHTHQESDRNANTFWTGCGAVARERFLHINGFDEVFGRPAVEDIEFGGRLHRSGGRILLCRDVLVTHHKDWDFATFLKTDIFDRAVPWTRFIVRQRSLPDGLNLHPSNRISALLAWVSIISLFAAFIDPQWLIVSTISVLAMMVIHRRLYRLFYLKGLGARFTVGAYLLHTLYFLYSSLTFVIVGTHELLKRSPSLSAERP